MTRWLILLGGALVLVALFFFLRPGDEEPASTTSPAPTVTATGTPSETPEPTPSATLDAIEIEVEEGRVEGPGTIEVEQGDRVAIEIKADVEDEVHVHGYDLFADVRPEREVTITFRASIPGVFEVELENAGLLLTRLEVGP